MVVSDKSEHKYRFDNDQLIGGRYRVIEPLGVGGFAEVYKCRDEQLDEVFAVKVMNIFAAKPIFRTLKTE